MLRSARTRKHPTSGSDVFMTRGSITYAVPTSRCVALRSCDAKTTDVMSAIFSLVVADFRPDNKTPSSYHIIMRILPLHLCSISKPAPFTMTFASVQVGRKLQTVHSLLALLLLLYSHLLVGIPLLPPPIPNPPRSFLHNL